MAVVATGAGRLAELADSLTRWNSTPTPRAYERHSNVGPAVPGVPTVPGFNQVSSIAGVPQLPTGPFAAAIGVPWVAVGGGLGLRVDFRA